MKRLCVKKKRKKRYKKGEKWWLVDLSKANTPNQIEKSIIVNIAVSVKHWIVERRKKHEASNKKKPNLNDMCVSCESITTWKTIDGIQLKRIISLAYRRISFYKWIVRCIIICPSFSRLFQCVFSIFAHHALDTKRLNLNHSCFRIYLLVARICIVNFTSADIVNKLTTM